MHRPALVAFLCLAAFARADDLADKVKAITSGPEYNHARWGILVVRGDTGAVIHEQNADKLFLPASVTKLFTCAAALAELGPDFRFNTSVHRHGTIKDKALDGDLVLVAGGDLTFGGRRGKDGATLFNDSDHTYANYGAMNAKLTETSATFALDDLAKQVASQVKEIRGEVLVDDRMFARTRSSGSGPEIVTPILVNDNVVDLTITPGAKAGEPAKVIMRPETAVLQMDADVRTGPSDSATTLTLEQSGPMQFIVRGSIAVGAKPAVRIYPVDDPTVFARGLFIEALRRQGVRVAASLHRPRRADLPARDAKAARIAEWNSEPLAETIKVTLKVSHNLYASTLPVLVGLKSGQGTAEAGLRRHGELFRGLGVDTAGLSFAGGAGGAPADSATPAATVSLLRAMAKHSAAKDYFDALPVLGVDGTLSEAVKSDSPAKGKVRAKTGTLTWYDSLNDRLLLRSKALAGELTTAKGTVLYFAMFVNDVPLTGTMTAADQGKVLGKLCEAIHQHGP